MSSDYLFNMKILLLLLTMKKVFRKFAEKSFIFRAYRNKGNLGHFKIWKFHIYTAIIVTVNKVCTETWKLTKHEKDGMHTSLKNIDEYIFFLNFPEGSMSKVFRWITVWRCFFTSLKKLFINGFWLNSQGFMLKRIIINMHKYILMMNLTNNYLPTL